MRISVARSTIVLGTAERALWQRRTADGRDLDDARRDVMRAARRLAARTGRTVEVYAPARAGGSLLEVVEPEGSQ